MTLQTSDFKELYHQRWGIETFFHILKNRLSLENFTGNTALAIQQDFYITMFLSNYESLLVYDTNIILSTKSRMYKNQLKVNKSISFNTVKQKSFELFYSNLDSDLPSKRCKNYLWQHQLPSEPIGRVKKDSTKKKINPRYLPIQQISIREKRRLFNGFFA